MKPVRTPLRARSVCAAHSPLAISFQVFFGHNTHNHPTPPPERKKNQKKLDAAQVSTRDRLKEARVPSEVAYDARPCGAE